MPEHTSPYEEKVVVADGTIWGSEEWYQARWDSLSDEQKEIILTHLRRLETLPKFKEAMYDPWFHFGPGMQIRNYLRQVMTDFHLPAAPYPFGEEASNWDDYYLKALEEA